MCVGKVHRDKEFGEKVFTDNLRLGRRQMRLRLSRRAYGSGDMVLVYSSTCLRLIMEAATKTQIARVCKTPQVVPFRLRKPTHPYLWKTVGATASTSTCLALPKTNNAHLGYCDQFISYSLRKSFGKKTTL